MTPEPRMKEVRCKGTIKTDRLAGKPCGKFLGLLSEPYKDVICPRCGHKNGSEEQTNSDSGGELEAKTLFPSEALAEMRRNVLRRSVTEFDQDFQTDSDAGGNPGR